MITWCESQERTIQSPELNQKNNFMNYFTLIIWNLLQHGWRKLKRSSFHSSNEPLKNSGRLVDDFLLGGDLLLHLLRAEHDANFDLHLNTICEVIPWMHAAGRHTYAKFLPMYIANMRALAQKHPDSYQHMQSGGFVVRRTDNHRFNYVATDQTLEQTANRDGKSKGVVVGFILRKSALSHWLITRHITAEYREAFKSLTHSETRPNQQHQDLGKTRLIKDEHDVQHIVDVVTHCQNPFDLNTVPPELINITSGHVASEVVSNSLCSFLERGTKKSQVFMSERIVENTKSKGFWDPVPRTKLLSFSDMRKPLLSMTKNKLAVDSELLFHRMLFV